jgi:hypothetical protein
MFTLQSSFKPLLLGGGAVGGGGVENRLAEVSQVTVNSKEENSQDFCDCPNYVQEFGLWLVAA